MLGLGLGLSILAGINGSSVNGLSTQTSWDRGRNGQWVIIVHLTKLWKAHL